MKKARKMRIPSGTYAGRELRIHPGSPTPFGAHLHEGGINFSVFTKHAKAVVLVITFPDPTDPTIDIMLEPATYRTGDVWHCFVENLPEGFHYAYRVAGTYAPTKGMYFDDHNVLVEPYAQALTGGEEWGKPVVWPGASYLDRTKCIRRAFLPSHEFTWGKDKQLNRPLKDSIIYELHVRGFTKHASSKVKNPGTFDAIIEKIPYFKELGITAVELMPINEFDENECMFSNPITGEKLKNYWGYSSIAFFAPKASYAASGKRYRQVEEFKKMVKALHAAGIEVILDVVFNHTAEGNEHGPTMSFRGFENSVYYIMSNHHYANYSGCGNTLNCNHPVVREMILSCLRYWVTEMHVDGFRFDLASILGRDHTGAVMANPPVLEAIAMDPVLAHTKIIAEAWDAAGLYQVGHFPAWQRWAEWNDKYRDAIRRFVKGDAGVTSEMATRIAGSSDLYGHSGRRPCHSINYVTCHDGFTLADQVSYNEKHNHENGENNNDGHNNNNSWNCGVEGPTQNARVRALRKRMMKNYMALLFLSQGTPMILAGDECGRTQRGNNNAYCQDNEISWFNWDLVKEHKDHFRFVKEMIALRKKYSVLRREIFYTGEKPYAKAFPDISWHGRVVNKPDFSATAQSIAFLISGTPHDGSPRCPDMYVAINSSHKSMTFKIPVLAHGKWHYKINTYETSPNDFYEEGKEPLLESQNTTVVKPYSLIMLISK